LIYIVILIFVVAVTEKSTVVTVRISPMDLGRIEAVRLIEKVDRTTLLRDFIEDGLRRRVVDIYGEGKLTASRAAEILGVSLREFLEMLEGEGLPVNWDSETARSYMKSR
jgi:predicted HTH domain antitoxin